MKQKIALIQLNSFSNINEAVRKNILKVYPEFELKIIDVYKEFNSNKVIKVLNYIFTVMEYFYPLITSKIHIRNCLAANSFFFNHAKKLVYRILIKDQYIFTFQTQSLFDASIKGIPNFIFTDNTMLENLNNTFSTNHILPSKKWLKLEKMMYSNAARIFVMSSNVYNSLINQYGIKKGKIEIVYAGSNFPESNVVNRQRNYNSKTILFVGSHWDRKGGPTLVKAFEKVIKKYPDAQLKIVSWTAPKIHTPNVTQFGKLSLQEVGELFSVASIFCLPSTVEPFGLVFLEAMMFKLPIVAAKVNAIPDFVNHGISGYLVEPNNVDQLTEALLNLLASPEKCESFGKMGYELYTHRYTWDKVISKMKLCIDEELKNPNSYKRENDLIELTQMALYKTQLST
ncbi:MAG: glycosyltransferase family 4 protein [Ignavibacteriales bacterium]|nr:glycosyltransferase family 4 protein [Ignavibacteriales bacterium]